MNERKIDSNVATRAELKERNRRGAFIVLAFFCLIGVVGFVALGVDLGVISLHKTRMQNAVDAAALAAAQEISVALEGAIDGVETTDVDGVVLTATDIAVIAAKAMAVNVGELNNVYVNPDVDVRFGQRTINGVSGLSNIQWGVSPYNVVEVVARRDNTVPGQPDSMLELFFAPVIGQKTAALRASAIAYVESRDIVMVLDYSGSMNDDSELRSISTLGQAAVESNIQNIWTDLGSPLYGNMPFIPDWVTIPGQDASGPIPHVDVTWKSTSIDVVSTKDLSNVVLQFANGNTYKFDNLNQGLTGTFQGTGGNSGQRIVKCWIKSGSNDSGDGPGYGELFDFYDSTMVKRGLGLDAVPYPYQSGSWDNYVDYARDSNGSTAWYDGDVYKAGYRRKFGMLTLINFWNRKKPKYSETSDLWKTRQYPVYAMKQGATLFTNFLQSLEFGDEVGLVTYDTVARVETSLNEADSAVVVDISADPISSNYAGVDAMQRHKQAAYYDYYTNISDGLDKAIGLLQTSGRYGARPTILLMTDGNANRSVANWSVPAGWDWSELTDYDGDGAADYSTNSSHKLSALVKAKEAADAGFTIHTLSVGNNADRDMMRAIAFIGGGTWIDVPGGTTVTQMEADMMAAFGKIAAKVPPAKLLPNTE